MELVKAKARSHLSQTLIRNKGGTSWKFAFQNDGTRSSAKLLFNENARWKLDVGRGRTGPCMTKAPFHVPFREGIAKTGVPLPPVHSQVIWYCGIIRKIFGLCPLFLAQSS